MSDLVVVFQGLDKNYWEGGNGNTRQTAKKEEERNGIGSDACVHY